ncbi:MAG TPA: outer membrane beta-barrel family protein, partial [Bacteroidales bacterium]|nr:outer membrane beta-barrel family protein [Bacteroidales bacterium]
TRINFYAFYNPFSQEYDGQAKAVSEMNNNGQWQALRNTSDINRSTFYSLYLKHSFNEKGGVFTFDISNYHLTGENVAAYAQDSDASAEFKNSSKPVQNALNIKADFIIPFGHNMTINAGARMRTYEMSDRTVADFKYSGEVYSAYATFSHTLKNFDWNLGLRVEESLSELKQAFHKSFLNILPSAALSYKVSSDKSLKFAVSNTVNRPNIYQLNPNLSMDDPYTIRSGNPTLDPEVRTAISLEYSRKIKSNFGSVRLFYNRNGSSINYLTFLNDTSVFETLIENLGTVHQSGFQFTGTFKAGRIITFIPYLRLYALFTDGNRLAAEFLIKNRSQIVVEPGFSSVFSFKHDINLGMNFQYDSPRNNVCGNSFSDPLYMISLDKTFKKRLKVGIVSTLPLTTKFTYRGSEFKNEGFYAHYAGDIQLPKALFWFKLSYQFNSGKKQEDINHSREDIDAVPKKGF